MGDKFIKYASFTLVSILMTLCMFQPISVEASTELPVTTKPVDIQAPTAPSDFKVVEKTATTVTFSWKASTDNIGVTGYNLYSGTSLVATTVGKITNGEKIYILTGLASNTTYKFTIKAKDAAGNVSAASNLLSVTTEPLKVPINLKAAALTDTSVTLSWTASADNGGKTNYNIYNGITLAGTTNGQTSFKITGLTPKTSYKFTVKARDKEGNLSAASTALSVTTNAPDTQAPTAPSNLKSTAQTDTSVSLSWIASKDNVKVTRYDIYSGTTLVGTTTGSTSYKVTKLTANTTYKFTVKAKDAAGNLSVASNVLSVTTKAKATDTQAPTAPSNLKSTAQTDTSVSLSWTASKDNVKVTGYNIYSGTTLVGTSSSTSYKATKLTANTTYKFTVKAKDAAGNLSVASNVLSVTTKATDTQTPTAPSNLKSTAQTDTSVSLSWTASKDNIKVTRYNIYSGTTLVGTTSSTSYKATKLTANTTYKFTVKAKDAAENVSVASNELSVTTNVSDTQAPTAPTNLKSTAQTDTSISLSWTASKDNIKVTGYNIYCGTKLVGKTSSTSYKVTGLTAETTYKFTVKAKDAAGNISEASTISSN